MSEIQPPTTFLTSSEVDLLCAPLKMRSARCRFLESQGIRYLVDARGNPIVPRDWLLMRSSASRAPTPAPDENSLRAFINGRKGPRRYR